jgi:AraC-like DNA-binding protein
MDIVITITGYLILACAVVSLFKAVEQIIAKKPDISNYALLLLLLCITYLQAAMGMYFIGAARMLPAALFTIGLIVFLAASYLAGPLAFLYYHSLINPLAMKSKIHLASGVAVSIFAGLYMATRPAAYLSGMKENFFYADHEVTMYLVLAAAVLFIVVYTATILKIELSVRNSASIKYAVRSLIVITAGLLLSPITLYAGFIFQWIWLTLFGGFLLIINNLLFILAQVRYRDFFQAMGREVRLARYRKSMLKGLDVDALHERLNCLMNVEKYYQNFDISMKSTADELSITPHQLSWFLNKKLRIDFRNFINRFRVEEAKQLLIEKLDQNVLTIGYHVGFGSKTSFNVTFKEYTGKTPKKYRNEFCKNNRIFQNQKN